MAGRRTSFHRSAAVVTGAVVPALPQHNCRTVIILLNSFEMISFIKTITCTTHIHQPNTFDYFEHQPITDKCVELVASAHARAGTIETILVRGKCKFIRLGSVFRQTIHKQGGFRHGPRDGYLSSKSHAEGEPFPLNANQTCQTQCR